MTMATVIRCGLSMTLVIGLCGVGLSRGNPSQTDIALGPPVPEPSYSVVIGDATYLSAHQADVGWELFKTDPSEALSFHRDIQ